VKVKRNPLFPKGFRGLLGNIPRKHGINESFCKLILMIPILIEYSDKWIEKLFLKVFIKGFLQRVPTPLQPSLPHSYLLHSSISYGLLPCSFS